MFPWQLMATSVQLFPQVFVTPLVSTNISGLSVAVWDICVHVEGQVDKSARGGLITSSSSSSTSFPSLVTTHLEFATSENKVY